MVGSHKKSMLMPREILEGIWPLIYIERDKLEYN